MAGMIVLSPHLDDAVLSCGQLLAARPDSVVVTIFAGLPRPRHRTPYDIGCGFRCSIDAVRARRLEDQEACSTLNARAVHLDWLDGQYRTAPVGEAPLRAGIRGAIEKSGLDDPAVFAPLGVNHSDHDAVCDAALSADIRDLWLYEELPARVLLPELAIARVHAVRHRGYAAQPRFDLELTARELGPLDMKEQAMKAYASQTHQLGSLGDRHCYLVPERYWRVVR